MFKGKVVAFVFTLLFATALYAGDVDDCLSNAGMMDWSGVGDPYVVGTPCALMKITICPAGDFELIRNSCGVGGTAQDFIWIEARDLGNQPIQGIPWTDYWLNTCTGKLLCLCATPITADSLTGADGKTTFQGRIAGGGCTVDGGGIWIAIQGKQIAAKPCPPVTGPKCLTVWIKSPDLIGGPGATPNCQVTLGDLGPFNLSYNAKLVPPNPPGKIYNPCCDYNDTNSVTLSDLGQLGAHMNHKCQ